jgi:hypothetical protein
MWNEKRVQHWIPRCLVGVIAVCLIGVFAFGSLFTTFVFWDDEGYFLLAYRDFLMGHTPYDNIYSMYGPYAFLSAGLFTAFDASNVTHDVFRWITLPVWLGIAILFAGLVWRWTGQFALCTAVALLIGLRLNGIAKAVGHPQLWIIAALAMVLSVGARWLSGVRHVRRAFWAGLIVGVILLFKVNIGLFILIAFALAVSLQLQDGWLRTLSFLISVLVASCLPAFMILNVAEAASERLFAFVYVVSLGGIIFAASRQPRPDPVRPAALLWLSAGLILAISVGIGGVLVTGTTPRGLVDGLIFAPLLLSRMYHNPFLDAGQKSSLLLCAIAAASAVVVIIVHRVEFSQKTIALAGVKTLAGTGLLLSLWYGPRAALTGSLLFLWLLVFNISQMEPVAYLERMLLALLSVLYSLQLFPMAGEQVDWATLMPITAAAVLLADGTHTLSKQTVTLGLRCPIIAASTLGLLLAGFLLASSTINAGRMWNRWQSLHAVDLPGTSWLRLPARDTTLLSYMTNQIAANCRTVLSVPGLYSFSLWSGVPPMEQRRINSWPFMWGNDVLKNELRNPQQGGCVLVSVPSYRFFQNFAAMQTNDDLLTTIRATMTPIASLQGLTLYRVAVP